MDDFETELKLGFLDEAAELIQDSEQCFLQLESASDNPEILEKIFRLAHNLKGSSKAVGLNGLADFTHLLESFLLKVKNKEIKINPSVISLLLKCNDYLGNLIQDLKVDLNATIDSTELVGEIRNQMDGVSEGGSGDSHGSDSHSGAMVIDDSLFDPTPLPSAAIDASQFTEDFTPAGASAANSNALKEAAQPRAEAAPQLAAAPDAPAPVVPAPQAAPSAQAKVDVSKEASGARSDSQSSSAPKAPVASAGGAGGLGDSGKGAAGKPQTGPTGQPVDDSIRISLNRLEKLMNFVGEMVILQTVLKEQVQIDSSLLLRKTVSQLGKVTKEVQDISMSLRMVPLKQTFQKMLRIVRDTSSELGKTVDLRTQGEETELDKTILDNLSDPLVHLIRNAVDHGIESKKARAEANKPEQGTIWLRAFHQSGNLMIEVEDDGGGLDPEKLKKRAIEKGILSQNNNLNDRDAYQLIFAPGFSTKTEVTSISGRGVGMDVVKTNIERMQGEISIETEIGKGTRFKVRLPLTLAIIDAMVILCDQSRYVLPLSHVHESVRPQSSDIKWVTGMGEVFCLRGENLPLYRLSHLLSKKPTLKPIHDSIAVVVRAGDTPFSILVDDIVGEYQVVIKKLGDEHRNLKGFSGSAILGDGRPSLILEILDLIERCKPLEKDPSLMPMSSNSKSNDHSSKEGSARETGRAA